LAAALLRVVKDAMPVKAFASASVVPSASVRGVDAGVSGGLDAGDSGRVVANTAAGLGDVDFGAAASRFSAGGAVLFRL